MQQNLDIAFHQNGRSMIRAFFADLCIISHRPARLLQIIDCKDQIAADLSIDSFIAGFRLAMRLSQELNMYAERRPARPLWFEEDAL